MGHTIRDYNYECATKIPRAGKIRSSKGEMPGLSIFLRPNRQLDPRPPRGTHSKAGEDQSSDRTNYGGFDAA
jgi:hypothetical protein